MKGSLEDNVLLATRQKASRSYNIESTVDYNKVWVIKLLAYGMQHHTLVHDLKLALKPVA
jgi:hypothetical protein